MFKIGVVGTGIIGLDHLKFIKESDKFELAAICDINEEKVRALAEEYQVPWCTDYKEIQNIAPLDAVLLNLPHNLHCESTIFFLERNIHVLLEKPMANTLAECDAIIAAEKKSKAKLGIAHPQRYFPTYQKVKELIESGAIGKVCMFEENRSCNYFEPDRPRWFLDKKLSGGGVSMNYGAHSLDKIFSVFGDDLEVTQIASSCDNYLNDCTIEGHMQFFLKFNNGVSAAITFSGYETADNATIFYGTKGAIKVHFLDLFINTNDEWVPVPIGPNRFFLEEYDDFDRLIRGEITAMPTVEYGRKIIEIIEKLQQNL